MEESWESWPLHMEMGHDDDFLEQYHTNDAEFLRDILQLPDFSSESESQSFHLSPVVQNNSTATVDGAAAATSDEMAGGDSPGNPVKGNSPNSIDSPQHASKRLRRSSSSRTYILSFDNSTVIPATPEPYLSYEYEQLGGEGTRSSNSPLSSKRTTLRNQNLEPKPRANQGGKKTRSDCQSMDHIMAERKRRQELTERFIALSATIPGLKKTDKASVLREAINYVKQLQERVSELEKRNKKRGAESSMIFLEKSDLCANEDSISSETSSGDCSRHNEALPEVDARVFEKEVLIEIHCEKENGIELKILDQLENLHLCVTAASALPFGNSTLGITIIAQMGDAYRMTVNDLVKNLRQVLLRSRDHLQH